MSKFIFIFLMIFINAVSFAQNEPKVQKGDISVSGGVGFFSFNNSGFPVFISPEYYIDDIIGIGIYSGFDQFNEHISSKDYLTNTVILDEYWKRRHYTVGVEGTFHFQQSSFPKFDPFISVVAGFRFIDNELLNAEQKQSQTKTRETALFADLGFNYFILDSVALHVRLGYSKSPFFAGINWIF